MVAQLIDDELAALAVEMAEAAAGVLVGPSVELVGGALDGLAGQCLEIQALEIAAVAVEQGLELVEAAVELGATERRQGVGSVRKAVGEIYVLANEELGPFGSTGKIFKLVP
jgi:hypothetical protein